MDKNLKLYYEEFHLKTREMPIEIMKQQSRIKVLKELLPTKKGDNNILFVGCGTGDELLIIKENKELGIGLDISYTALRKAKMKNQNFIFIQGDAHYIPFRKNSFNIIICSEVLEHLSNAEKCISEIYRVLREQGIFILTVPNWISLFGLFRKVGEIIIQSKLTSDNQPIDNWFTPSKLRNLIKKYFTIIEDRGIWYYPPTGKGGKRIPDKFIYPVFKFLMPLNNSLSKIIPNFGHCLALKCQKRTIKRI